MFNLVFVHFLQVELFSKVCSAKPQTTTSLLLLFFSLAVVAFFISFIKNVFITIVYKSVHVTCFHVNVFDLFLVHKLVLLLVREHD